MASAAGIKAENMLLDRSGPPNVKISSVGYYKATLDTVPKSKVGSFGFVGTSIPSISPSAIAMPLVMRHKAHMVEMCDQVQAEELH